MIFFRVTDVNEEFRGRNDKFIFEASTFYGKKRIKFELVDRQVIDFLELDIIENNIQECSFLRTVDVFMYNEIIYNTESYSQSISLESDLQITKIYVSNDAISSIFGFENIPIPRQKLTIDFIGDRLHNVEIERDERIRHFATTMSEAQQFSTQFLREYYTDFQMPRSIVSIRDDFIGEVSNVNINVPKSNTFSYTKKDKEVREFIDGHGLFKIGVKKFNDVLPIKEQWKKINELSYVTNIKKKSMDISVDLNDKGSYRVCLKERPTSFRVDFLLSYQNPFLSADDNHICLGNMEDTYERCWHSKNYLQCLKIAVEVLRCDDDSKGYRKWSNCK